MDSVISAIQSFLDWLSAVFVQVSEWVLLVIGNFFDSLLLMAKDLFVWLFASLLALAANALDAISIDFPALFPGLFSALPSEVANVIGLLGLGDALGIIVAALGVRFLLQMIPVVRWGG